MRYLVAADGSEESDRAVEYAATQAVAFDATLEVVHVLEPETELVGGEIVLPGGERATELGEQTLAQARRLAVESVDGEDPSVETELLAGRPAHAIATRARETGTDAIFVGHRGLSEERERVVGSVAKSVVDRADVPVTVVR
jgi:nucleotide-binding universal stress UspA family protein